MHRRSAFAIAGAFVLCAMLVAPAMGQLVDRTLAPNAANAGIAKSFEEQIGAGRGSINIPGSSLFIIARDPARAVRRGRQIFQRKFTRRQGQGPLTGDGAGDIAAELSIGAGLMDSCAGCHGRPRGSAGFGGDVVTRPDSRDAPHLFGLGLKEMLADQITADLRRIRDGAVAEARATGQPSTKLLRVSVTLATLDYGSITARADGTVDTAQVQGVDADLRVRPFFFHGGTISIREFLVGAFNAEMGLEAPDPDLLTASRRGRVVTPSGMVLDGNLDRIEAPPVTSTLDDPDNDGVTNEVPTSIVDFMEFYLLHYFKPALGAQDATTAAGRNLLQQIGCTTCHVPDMVIARDRRVADVETVFDTARGNPFNRLFATASLMIQEQNDGTGFPTLKRPQLGAFVVRNIFTDFKRHDLGPNFHEREFAGTTRRDFLTTPLWGVGSSAPYGHDGRSMSLEEVIRRHGGEAIASRNSFVALGAADRNAVLAFLSSLILFPPDDTPSSLEPAVPGTPGFPQVGHGSIRLGALFNNPNDPE
jgi:di-heme oxidoreductase (putative peroxidase)